MTTPMTLNGIAALRVRLAIPWRGVWTAEVELDSGDLPITAVPTSGPALLTVGGLVMRGTIDPRTSGTIANKAHVTVVGGGGGWDDEVSAKFWQTPILSTLVYNATAISVKEVVIDTAPQTFQRFARLRGPASRVFEDRDWFVDPVAGSTVVGAWPTLPFDPDGVIAAFEPLDKRFLLISDSVILPGTLVADSRLNGKTYTVRTVEQTFDRSGSKAECWCSDSPIDPLMAGIAGAVRELAQTAYLQVYKYRFAAGTGNALQLQAVTKDAPDLNPLEQWSGLSGAADVFQPGTEILVGFVAGDPKQPYIVSYSPFGLPVAIALTASAGISLIAPSIAISGALTVGVPGTAQPLAFGAWAAALAAALTTFATGLNGGTLSGNASALLTALGNLPPAQTAILKGN